MQQRHLQDILEVASNEIAGTARFMRHQALMHYQTVARLGLGDSL